MCLPLELEHLIKTADAKAEPQRTEPPKTPLSRLEAIEARKALELEHYLRACALRLDLG
jgi:hypothetical protein